MKGGRGAHAPGAPPPLDPPLLWRFSFCWSSLLSKVKTKDEKKSWQRLGDLQLELMEEQMETWEVFRKFKSILNRLTPQKFNKLADMTLQLKINTEERMRGVVDMIYTKVRKFYCQLILEHHSFKGTGRGHIHTNIRQTVSSHGTNQSGKSRP